MADSIHLIQEIVNSTREEPMKGRIVDASMDLTEYFVANKFAADGGKRVVIDSGIYVTWLVKLLQAQAAMHVAHDTPYTAASYDTTVRALLHWRKLTANFTIDAEEQDINSGAQELYDYTVLQRLDMDQGIAAEMERAFVAKPPDSDDVTEPMGLPYWYPKNATEGFNGGTPTGFAAGCAGISSSTYENWNSYTGAYTNITPDDLLFMLRTAFRKTNFRSPVPVQGIIGTSESRQILTNDNVITELEELVRLQNDNLGVDLIRYMNSVVINGFEVTAMPQLNADEENPLYIVPWDVFKFQVHGDWWMKESPPIRPEGFNNKYTVVSDTRYNIRCDNRRTGGVLHKPA